MPSGLLIVDKPEGWTSHDVVAKLRGILKERRVGHGGTLDPMATGVLVIFTGRATRAAEYLPGDKTYVAKFRTGASTDTQDSTGSILQTYNTHPAEDEIRSALQGFCGEIFQVPPMVSAVKINGQPLYKLARKGIEVERKAKKITIYSIESFACHDGEYTIRVKCSSGTYIRTLIHDMGQKLGCGAFMTALRRTGSGPFDISQAVTLENAGWDRLLPLDELFKDFTRVNVSGVDEKRLRNGAAVEMVGSNGRVRVYGENGEFLLLGRIDGGKLSVEKSFFEV